MYTILLGLSILSATAADDVKFAVLSGRQAIGKNHVADVQITSSADADEQCCSACSNTTCEFWVRDIAANKCHLYSGWTRTVVNVQMRTGFKGENVLLSKVFKLAYGVVGDVLKRVNIHLGTVVKDFRLELPPLSNVVFAKDAARNHVAILQDMKLLTSGSIDDVNEKDRGFNGSMSAVIELEPYFDIDTTNKTCKTTVTQPGIWNLGVGFEDHVKGMQSLSNDISGPDHSSLRNDCKGLLPAYPGQELVDGRGGCKGNIIGLVPVCGALFLEPACVLVPGCYWAPHPEGKTLKTYTDEDSRNQTELDKWCCEACNNISECDAFQVSDKWGTSRSKPLKHKCELRSYSWKDERKHANVKGVLTPKKDDKDTYDMDGAVIHVQKRLEGNSQADIDARCAAMCGDTPGCEIWSAHVVAKDLVASGQPLSSTCTLKRSSRTSGLANKGLLGVSGEKVVNWLGKVVIKQIIDLVLEASHICSQDDSFTDLLNLVNSDTTVEGSGDITLDVPDDFFQSMDLGTPDAMSNLESFQVLQKHLAGSMQAKEPRLQFLVDAVLTELESVFAAPMAMQVASPLAFWLGGVLSQCINDPVRCGEQAPHIIAMV